LCCKEGKNHQPILKAAIKAAVMGRGELQRLIQCHE
jgi:hypothetical protein